jgi:hypothetical protein
MRSERCITCLRTADLAGYEADESYGYGTKAALELALENQRKFEESAAEIENMFSTTHSDALWGRIIRRLSSKHLKDCAK